MRVRRFPLGSLWTNGYLVWDARGRGLFVDPGGEDGVIPAFLEQEKIELQCILLTHGHADHLAGVEALRTRTGARVGISKEDAFMLTDAAGNLSQFMGEPIRCRAADVTFGDETELFVGDLRVRVLATPGHTRGSVSFLIHNDEEWLFSGDTLFAQSVGRTDLPGGDDAALRASLRKLAGLAETLRVFPGHGPETTLGQERAANPFWPRGEV